MCIRFASIRIEWSATFQLLEYQFLSLFYIDKQRKNKLWYWIFYYRLFVTWTCAMGFDGSCSMTSLIMTFWAITISIDDSSSHLWWVACIFVPPVTQSCRRMKGPNRHGWLVVLRRIFCEHSDRGYLLYSWVVTFPFSVCYLLVEDRSSCTSRFCIILFVFILIILI